MIKNHSRCHSSDLFNEDDLCPIKIRNNIKRQNVFTNTAIQIHFWFNTFKDMDDDSNNTAKWMEIISAFDKGSIHRKCSTNEDLVFAIALLVLTGKKISPFEFITRTLIMDSSHIQLKNQSKFKDIFFKTIYSGEMLLSFNMARPPPRSS